MNRARFEDPREGPLPGRRIFALRRQPLRPVKRTLTLLAALLATVTAPAPAPAAPTEVGLQAAFANGAHTETAAPAGGPTAYSQATANMIPAPFLHLDQPLGRFALRLESIPPLGTIPVAKNGLGLDGVQLSYLGMSARYQVNAQAQIYAGETIYDQQSNYDHGTYTERDRSRVAGVQYGALVQIHQGTRSRATFDVAFNPHMSSNLVQSATFVHANGTSQTFTITTPEAGSQIYMTLSNVVRAKARTSVEYGVRYLNLTMKFPDGTLADRNAFWVPFVGLSTTIGR